MKLFIVAKYSDNVPVLGLDPEAGHGQSYIGHMGKDGELLIERVLAWAAESGIIGDFEKALRDFFEYAKKTYIQPDQTSVGLTLRKVNAGAQVDEWKIPRPHHDGWYWDPKLNNGREQFKIGTVLLGPGTVLWDVESMDEETRKKAQHIIGKQYHERQRENDATASEMELRQWATDELDKLGVPRVQPKQGECIRWVVGDNDNAAIHSEPDMSDMPTGRIL